MFVIIITVNFRLLTVHYYGQMDLTGIGHRGMAWIELAQHRRVASFCKHSYETVGCIKCREFLDSLRMSTS